jgi:hypothetical protein
MYLAGDNAGISDRIAVSLVHPRSDSAGVSDHISFTLQPYGLERKTTVEPRTLLLAERGAYQGSVVDAPLQRPRPMATD